MGKDKNTSKTLGMVLTAVIVLILTALAIFRSDYSFTERQKETLKILMIVCGCSVAYCFIVGEIVQNFSQMDKLWSILPIAYVWIVAIRGEMKLRLVIFALIVTAWGIRLTINFARKGAYRLKFWEGEEDYRWSIVRKSGFFRKPFMWTLFNLFFISFYQNLLVLAICFPALACMESNVPLGFWDIMAILFAILFLMLESVADEYQWDFQQTKKKLLAEYGELSSLPAPYHLGFNTTGPWGFMRHPNYLGEQGIWLSLFLFAVGAGVTRHGIFHWSLAGPLLLVLLFVGSSELGESISLKKYPRYKDYIAEVHKYIPLRHFDPEKAAREEKYLNY